MPALLLLIGILTASGAHAQPPAAGAGVATAGNTAAPAVPRGPNSADRRNAKDATQAVREGRRPEGVLPLLRILRRWDAATPARTRALFEQLCEDRRLSPSRQVTACRLFAEARLRMGEPQAAWEGPRDLGYVTEFRVIGGFDNEGKLGLTRQTPVEAARMQAPDLQASFAGKERDISWRELPKDISRRGFVSLHHLLRPVENVCGLAETFVKSDRDRVVSLWFGAGGGSKVYWNGETVLEDESYRQPFPDRHAVGVRARKGWNRLLVKTCVTDQAWGFFLRLGDAKGAVASGLSVATNTTEALDVRPVAGPAPRVTQAPLAAIERAATGKRPTALALERFSRLLWATLSDDTSERQAKQFAERAVDSQVTLERLLLAAELSEERAEVMRFSAEALHRYPTDDRAQLLHARILQTGLVPEDALPVLATIGEDSDQYVSAQLMRADILNDLGLPRTALSVLQAVRARTGDTPRMLRALGSAYAATGDRDSAMATHRARLAGRYERVGLHRVIAQDALSRGVPSEVAERIDALSLLRPGSLNNLRQIASLYDGLGRDDMALATYRRAVELVPDSAPLRFSLAKYLLLSDQQAAAADSLRVALRLSPQHRQARELLEQLKPEERADEAFAIDQDALLQRRSKGRGYPTTVLHDLSVSTVYDNGLGSRFRQYAVQVHDKAGARQHRTHAIQYDPDSQRIDVRLARVYRKDGRVLESIRAYEQQLGEPWYRIYYDTRALVVVFPDLEPGDVVEIRYRVDDVAHRNLFADYYGDLHLLQGRVPTVHKEVVLVTPKDRTFHRNEPELAGLEHDSRVDGPRRIDRWVARDVGALSNEPGMPGPTEVLPYLHVSTYGTWEDVGHWYWGLIRDQLYADASLKATVKELIEGAATTRDKVTRIHQWVLSHTRYVGLEFGIHGFLPYRVPLIVQRGFGDCKDKASLLYTMFREAGVDARIVLVRTRRNGRISDLPASLAVFDHAIAYVPELDLYIDGTAEHSGITELPEQDQGVTVLVVGPDDVRLTRTPVLPADSNVRHRQVAFDVAKDGSATAEADEEITGASAAGYRSHYQAEGTRKERLQRSLAQTYPGVELKRQRFEPLTDLEVPVRYHYQMQMPQFGHWDGDLLRLPVSSLNDLTRSLARTPARKLPLDLDGKSVYREDRTLTFPSGMTTAFVPESASVRSAFGSLTMAYKVQPRAMQIHTELRLERDRITAEEYPEFRKWVKRADQLLKQRIDLRRKQP